MKFSDYNFGSNFEDACFSKLALPDEYPEKILSWVKNPKFFFIFTGNPGVGKTYMCACFVKYCLEKNFPVRYYKQNTFLQSLRQAIGTGSDYEFEIQRLCDCPFFILDDLGSSKSSDWERDVIFSVIDTRHASCKPTLITSNVYLDGLKDMYGQRFDSRMRDKRNTILELNWIDKRQEKFDETHE